MDQEKYQAVKEKLQQLIRQSPSVDMSDAIESLQKFGELMCKIGKTLIAWIRRFWEWGRENLDLLKKIMYPSSDKKKEYRKFVESLQRKRYDNHKFSKRTMNSVQRNLFILQRRKIIPKH